MLPDNRMQFPPTLIDFEASVGTTGQAHDSYPSPGTPARFDWARIAIISLLANQSSFSPPTQYRQGTLWYNLNTGTLYIWQDNNDGGAWESAANAIGLLPDGTMSLQAWFNAINPVVNGILPILSFSGLCGNAGAASLPIPTGLQ